MNDLDIWDAYEQAATLNDQNSGKLLELDSSSPRCAQCGSAQFVCQNALSVCCECGAVAESDEGEVMVAGAASTSTSSLGTLIRGSSKQALCKRQIWLSSAKDKRRRAVAAEFAQLSSALQMPGHVIEAAVQLFDTLITRLNVGYYHCKRRAELRAACVYHASRECNLPLQRKEIATKLNIPLRSVTKGINVFLDVMDRRFRSAPPINAFDFVDRFCAALNVVDREYVRDILTAIHALGLLADKTPTSQAAAAILFAVGERHLNLTRDQIQAQSFTSAAVLLKNQSILNKHKEHLNFFCQKLVETKQSDSSMSSTAKQIKEVEHIKELLLAGKSPAEANPYLVNPNSTVDPPAWVTRRTAYQVASISEDPVPDHRGEDPVDNARYEGPVSDRGGVQEVIQGDATNPHGGQERTALIDIPSPILNDAEHTAAQEQTALDAPIGSAPTAEQQRAQEQTQLTAESEVNPLDAPEHEKEIAAKTAKTESAHAHKDSHKGTHKDTHKDTHKSQAHHSEPAVAQPAPVQQEIIHQDPVQDVPATHETHEVHEVQDGHGTVVEAKTVKKPAAKRTKKSIETNK